MHNQESAPTPHSESESPNDHERQIDEGAGSAKLTSEATTAPRPPSSPSPVVMPVMMPAGLPFAAAPGGISGLSVQQVQVWQGQFPPPEAIERYNHVLPGAFDRIIRMAERQSDASIEAAADARRSLREDSRRGIWLGWSVTVAAIVGALYCATIHQPWVAAALVAVPVMGVAKALIDSDKSRHFAPITAVMQAPGTTPPSIPKPAAQNPAPPQQDEVMT